MSARDCARCERPVSDALVCSLCAGDAEKALERVAGLIVELDLTISRQRRFLTHGNNGGRSTETSVPFNVKAGEVRDELRAVMVSWVKLYAEESRADLPANRLSEMARYLRTRVEWFRHHNLAAEFVDEITDVVRQVVKIVDAPANLSTFAVGPCPEVDELRAHCPGVVHAIIPASRGVARLECSESGAVWGTWQWLRIGPQILARHAELEEAVGCGEDA